MEKRARPRRESRPPFRARSGTGRRIGGHRALHALIERWGAIGASLARHRDLAGQFSSDDDTGLLPKQPLTGEELTEHLAGGVDVGAAIDVARTELLRRHIGQLALHLSFPGRLHPVDGFGDSEVEHAGDTVGRDQDVLR